MSPCRLLAIFPLAAACSENISIDADLDGEGATPTLGEDPTSANTVTGDDGSESMSGSGSDGSDDEDGSDTSDGDSQTSEDRECGDGVVDPGEECDDGNNDDGDYCEADCTLPACENGILDLFEMCLATSGESFPVPRPPEALVLGDLDEDGRLDMVVRNRDGSIDRWLQADDGVFELAPIAADFGVVEIRLADVDADDHLDVLGLDRGSRCASTACGPPGSQVAVWPGRGDGTVAPPVLIPAGVRAEDWAMRDIDDDERSDLVIADAGASELAILINTGDAQLFAPAATVSSPAPPNRVEIGDLDRDRIPDLIATARDDVGGSVLLFLADAPGSFVYEASLAAAGEVYDLAVMDIQPDGLLDIMTTDPAGNRVRVFPGSYDAFYPDHVDLEAEGGPTHLWSGQVDAHGHGDVGTSRDRAHTISLSIGVGSVESWWIHTVVLDGRPGGFDVGDINGDGAPDLAATLLDDNLITIVLAQP